MASSAETIRNAYAAYARGDIPALLEYVDDSVDWECVVSKTLPYTGPHRGKDGVARFFAEVPRADDIQVFEPREFIEAGDHVTVLGWERTRALETGKTFESEWAHVFTVRNGRITRWRGFYDTLARMG